jgi:cytosine/adenosine deaminase-related metal-dependent hydrolase
LRIALRGRSIVALLLMSACGTSAPSQSDDAGNPFAEDGAVLQQAPLDGALPGDDDATLPGDDDATLSSDAGPEDGATLGDDDATVGTPDAPPVVDDDGGPAATVTLGTTGNILLLGTIVTPDVTFVGEVLVEGSTITCVQSGTACASQSGAFGATVIDTKGVIAPGLIDTHNHILFDIFDDDDWLPSKTYTNHNQWTAEPRYGAMLDTKECLEDASQGKPTWCPATYAGAGSLKCEMDKWGELKGLVAGTTSIVGLPGTSSACFGSLSRSIDVSENGLGTDAIQTSALFPPSKASGDGVCTNFTSMKTDAYLIHCGEGTDAPSLAEFAKLGSLTTDAGCLYAPETVITHGTAFTANEFGQMAGAGMKLTWSPKSNVALYAATTDIPAALDAGVLVTLAPDWSMGGSQNILDEMRFADAWDDAHFGNRLAAKDLVEMTTKNAAMALALSSKIGSLEVGMLADLMVVSATKSDPYASLVAATPADVRLTMVGGVVLYGDAQLQPAAPQTPACEALSICSAPKFLCVAESATNDKLNQTYAQIATALGDALVDLDSVRPDAGYAFAPIAPIVKCP